MATSTKLTVALLVVILALEATVCLGVSDKGRSGGCAHYRGFCREACYPQEKSLGSEGCPEGMVCCMSGTWGHIGAA